MSWENKLISLEELTKWSTHVRELALIPQEWSGRRIVATNGCFDIIHAAHVGLLKQARALGTHLIVGLNSDDSVTALKGPSRPINNQEDRAFVLSEFESVFRICIFDDKTADRFLEACKPDIYMKGGDYTLDSLNEKERKVLDDYKSQILFCPMVEGVSTTKALEKLNKKIKK